MQIQTPTPGARCHAPATLRNREPILEVLRRSLPASGLVLEVASGTGEHAAYFAAALPHLTWQPTDVSPDSLASIAAWAASAACPNLLAPCLLDATSPPATWPVQQAAAIVCINMLHIAPWTACEGLMAGAAHVLDRGDLLYLYGPFKVGGAHTADSNAAFDASLRQQDRRWGVRDVADVAHAGKVRGLELQETVQMPANNLSLLLRRK